MVTDRCGDVARMHRALWEFRIRGVVTNLRFLDQLIMHPKFVSADYTTRFIDQTPELFRWQKKRDRATRILTFVADVIVNGNPEVNGRPRPPRRVVPRLPRALTLRRPPAANKSSTRWARRNSPRGCSLSSACC